MRIHSCTLTNFRSYTALELDVSSHNVHVFCGDNGAGKTNIIEAMSILSVTKSFQVRDETDLLHWGESLYRLKATIESDATEIMHVEVASQLEPRKKKVFFKNDVQLLASQLVGTLPTVLFVPQDLDLFIGAPARRRHFLDQLLCQVSPEYMVALSQYQKILKQRNALLKKIADNKASASELSIWNQQLAKEGAYITQERMKLIGVWQLTIQEELASLGETWNDVLLAYERKGVATELPAMQQEIEVLLQKNEQKDIVLQSTSVGPHREDWGVIADGRNITTFASRGQNRTVMLALLLLETSFLQLQRGETPVILLDDVFSELDVHHQKALLTALTSAQVFITTAVLPPTINDAKIWQVTAGNVA